MGNSGSYNFEDIKDSKCTTVEDYESVINNSLKLMALGTLLSVVPIKRENITIFGANSDIHFDEIICDNYSNEQDNSKTISLNIDEFINKVNSISSVKFTKDEIRKNILSFKSLKESWDGYGALPLEIGSASNALKILEQLDLLSIGKIDDFYPNSHGTISFEWINNLHEKLFLEIGNDYFSFFVKYSNNEPLFFDELKISNENIKLLSEKIRSI